MQAHTVVACPHIGSGFFRLRHMQYITSAKSYNCIGQGGNLVCALGGGAADGIPLALNFPRGFSSQHLLESIV